MRTQSSIPAASRGETSSRRRRHTVAAVAVLALAGSTGALLPRVARACENCFADNDAKIVPGSNCVVKQNQGSDWTYEDRGGICNTHETDRLQVICPVIRDDRSNTDGLRCLDVQFYNDQPPSLAASDSDNATCAIASYSSSGQSYYYTSSDGPDDPSGGTYIDMHIESSYANGYHLVRCMVTPKAPNGNYSCLRSYRYDEEHATDGEA